MLWGKIKLISYPKEEGTHIELVQVCVCLEFAPYEYSFKFKGVFGI